MHNVVLLYHNGDLAGCTVLIYSRVSGIQLPDLMLVSQTPLLK